MTKLIKGQSTTPKNSQA